MIPTSLANLKNESLRCFVVIENDFRISPQLHYHQQQVLQQK
jgi:hypothetical protein